MRTHLAIAVLAVAFTCGPAQAQQTEPQWWNLNGIGTQRPSPRQDAAIAPSPSGEVVLFGGSSASGDLNDTWVFTVQGWEERAKAPSLAPPPMRWARMVYDSRRGRSVLVGYASSGNTGPQTWFWDGETWTPLGGASALRAEPGFSLAFDEVTGEVLLFGGYAVYGADSPCMDDTWVLAGGTVWTWLSGSHPPLQPAPPGPRAALTLNGLPPARVYGAMAYDRSSNQIMLHGGLNQCRTSDQTLTDTWVWDRVTRTWTEILPASHPPANEQGYQLAYYGMGSYLVAAGCTYYLDACGMYDPTSLWKWDGTDWSQIPGPGPQDPTKPWTAPRADYGFAFSEVPGYDGLLLFGGWETTYLDETWAWGVLPEILNTAPTAVIIGPPAGEVACTVPTGTPVTFDGRQSSDAENQPLTYLWTGPFGSRTSSMVDVPLPIGKSEVTLKVSDGKLEDSASQSVIVAVGVQGLESPLGPLTPIDAPPPPPPTVFSKAGSTMHLKLTLTCGAQVLTGSDVVPPILVSVKPWPGSTGRIVTAGSAAISPDTVGVFRTQGTSWIYNLQTKGLGPGIYELLIEMPDTLAYRALIGLR